MHTAEVLIKNAPPLAASAVVQANDPASLINIVLYGPDEPKDISFGAWETMKPYKDVLARMLHGVASVVIGVLVLLVPAQGISDTRGLQPIDACTLLMTSELSALLGMPVEAGTRHDAGLTSQGAYSSTCLWKVRNARLLAHDPNASLGGADFAILNVFSWSSRAGAETFLRSFRSAADSNLIPMHPVALDIGDEGLWWGDGVAVRKGAVSFGISVVLNSADRDKRRVLEESLAKKILARIHSDNQR